MLNKKNKGVIVELDLLIKSTIAPFSHEVLDFIISSSSCDKVSFA